MEAGAEHTCALRILLLYELLAEPAVQQLLLPINSLRNAAILAVDTPLVAMIDVDLLLSATLGRQLVTAEPPHRQWYVSIAHTGMCGTYCSTCCRHASATTVTGLKCCVHCMTGFIASSELP